MHTDTVKNMITLVLTPTADRTFLLKSLIFPLLRRVSISLKRLYLSVFRWIQTAQDGGSWVETVWAWTKLTPSGSISQKPRFRSTPPVTHTRYHLRFWSNLSSSHEQSSSRFSRCLCLDGDGRDAEDDSKKNTEVQELLRTAGGQTDINFLLQSSIIVWIKTSFVITWVLTEPYSYFEVHYFETSVPNCFLFPADPLTESSWRSKVWLTATWRTYGAAMMET